MKLPLKSPMKPGMHPHMNPHVNPGRSRAGGMPGPRLPSHSSHPSLRAAWLALALMAALLLAGCASGVRQPDWQLEARAAADRFAAAYLSGRPAPVHDADWQRLHQALAATAAPQQLARAELLRCALQVASLDWQPGCAGFERWRHWASNAERAYADYLLGRWDAASLQALPAPQRQLALGGAAALPGQDDALTRLVGAAVLLRAGPAAVSAGDAATQPDADALVALAVDTASSQGWRRPLAAWLGLQLRRAEAQGRRAEVQRIGERLQLLGAP